MASELSIDTADARTSDQRELFDLKRTVVVRLDVFLDATYVPGCQLRRHTCNGVAMTVIAAAQQRHDQRLLHFP